MAQLIGSAAVFSAQSLVAIWQVRSSAEGGRFEADPIRARQYLLFWSVREASGYFSEKCHRRIVKSVLHRGEGLSPPRLGDRLLPCGVVVRCLTDQSTHFTIVGVYWPSTSFRATTFEAVCARPRMRMSQWQQRGKYHEAPLHFDLAVYLTIGGEATKTGSSTLLSASGPRPD